jgi:hypothetical protein
MSKQTVIFASVTASLVPIGMLIVLALNPHASLARGVQVILDRGRERPVLFFRIIALMIVFAGLGPGRSPPSLIGFDTPLQSSVLVVPASQVSPCLARTPSG